MIAKVRVWVWVRVRVDAVATVMLLLRPRPHRPTCHRKIERRGIQVSLLMLMVRVRAKVLAVINIVEA